jgi:hypothetical protein
LSLWKIISNRTYFLFGPTSKYFWILNYKF